MKGYLEVGLIINQLPVILSKDIESKVLFKSLKELEDNKKCSICGLEQVKKFNRASGSAIRK